MSKNGDDSSSGTSDGVVSRSALSSFRALSKCIKVISSGASTVARSAVSAASSALKDAEFHHDQVIWAGFDKLEKKDGVARRVLLIAFRSGFQVWDVEDTENVHAIVSAHDGQAFFMQMLPNPLISEVLDDRFRESRPLLAVCGDNSWGENSSKQITSENPGSDTIVTPTNVYVYSLKSRSYVRTINFRSTVYSVRCSSRIVAVLKADEIHCFDATTLEMVHMIVSNSIAFVSSSIGYGPLAVGPRWIAYSGSRIPDSSSAVCSSELISLSSSPSVAQFARESSKQLASGIVSIGDRGYRSLTGYCSEVLPNPYIPGLKRIGVVNENVADADSIGMVIVKDVVNNRVITQFKAHKSPIAALRFDPSGMLLVTASIQGHNINVFRIMPTISTSRNAKTTTFSHPFRLQRGLTNAVIQDICFSNDSNLIVVSSLRGTSHMFEINPEKEGDSPVPLSAIIRIRSNNSSGWIGTMSDAASAAAGMVGGSVVGTITSTFCYCNEKSNKSYGPPADYCSKTSLLVFDHSGCMTQYDLRENSVGVGHETAAMTGFDFESGLETEGKLVVDPIRRWYVIKNQSRREMQDHHADIYSGGVSVDSKSKVPPEVVRNQTVEKGTTSVEDMRHFYIYDAEVQRYMPSQQPLWAKKEIMYQEFVNPGEETSGEGGGEIEIEEIKTRTIEARKRDLIPVWGYLQSPRSQRVVNESMQSMRNIIQGDQRSPLKGRGTETYLGDVHSEEKTQSESVNEEGIAEEKGHGTETDLGDVQSEEKTQSGSVNEEGIAEEKGHGTETDLGDVHSESVNEEGIAEEKGHSEDDDDDEEDVA